MEAGNLWRNSARKRESGAVVSYRSDNISAIMTEVEALTLLYIYYGGADDSTLPDHEIPLLRGILEGASPPSPGGDWILETKYNIGAKKKRVEEETE
jgi:hypothetical protein